MLSKFIGGVFKSPLDSRDLLVKSFLTPVHLPSAFDISDKMTAVRSQGQEGSCVGFAMVVGVKEYQEQIDYSKFISLSPRYIYEKAKEISGHSEGTTLKAAVIVAKRDGVCEERYWRYIANDVGTPDIVADKNASKYKLKSYARITNLEELKNALVQFGACMIGVNVYKGMIEEEAGDTGIVPDPTCFQRSIGGHAITACGYNDSSPYYKNDGHVKFKNSWGTWGLKGYGYLSYKYIKKNMIDAFSAVDINDVKPFNLLTVGDLSPAERTKAEWL